MFAPRARMPVNAWWPGVSMNVTRFVLSPSPMLDHPRGGVLRDAARFAGGDVGVADLVEQAGLAVVDVAEDRDDRRARHAGSPASARGSSNSCIELLFQRRLLRDLQLDAVLQRDRLGGLGVERLVDVGEDALLHQLLDDVVGS